MAADNSFHRLSAACCQSSDEKESQEYALRENGLRSVANFVIPGACQRSVIGGADRHFADILSGSERVGSRGLFLHLPVRRKHRTRRAAHRCATRNLLPPDRVGAEWIRSFARGTGI